MAHACPDCDHKCGACRNSAAVLRNYGKDRPRIDAVEARGIVSCRGKAPR